MSRNLPLLLLLLPTLAWAHGLRVFATWETGQILVEAYYDDGELATGEVVVRYGERELAREQLDSYGTFRWRPERAGIYRVEVTEPGQHTGFAHYEVYEHQLHEPTTPVPHEPRPVRQRPNFLWPALLGVGVIAFLAWRLQAYQRGREP